MSHIALPGCPTFCGLALEELHAAGGCAYDLCSLPESEAELRDPAQWCPACVRELDEGSLREREDQKRQGAVGPFVCTKEGVGVEPPVWTPMLREPLPVYRALWSADRRTCALWLDRGDRAELLGYVENHGSVLNEQWEAFAGDVLPRHTDGGSFMGTFAHAWKALLYAHGAPDVRTSAGQP